MLPFKILTQVPFSAISLPAAKHQCRLRPSQNTEEELLSSLILGAASAAQEYLNWMVSKGTVIQFSPEGGTLQLYGGFVKAITEVKAYDSTFNEITLGTDDYKYNPVTEQIYVNPNLYYDIYVTYECGADVDELPDCVRVGILMMISTMFNNREDFITGLTVEKMPLKSQDLLGLRRLYVS